MKRTLTVAAAAAIGLMIPGAAFAAHGGSTYTANLSELNGSGAGGTVTVQLNDDASQATITRQLDRPRRRAAARAAHPRRAHHRQPVPDHGRRQQR